jgi:hypothetical protein
LQHPTNRGILLVFLEKAVPAMPKMLGLLGALRNDVKAIVAFHEEALNRLAVLPLEGDREALREVLDVIRV